MESSLRDVKGYKPLRVQFGIHCERAIESGDIKVDLSAIEFTGFHVDKLIVDMIGVYDDEFDDPDQKVKKYSEGLRGQLELEVRRLGTVLVDKNICLTLHGKKAPFLFDSVYKVGLTLASWLFEVTKA